MPSVEIDPGAELWPEQEWFSELNAEFGPEAEAGVAG